MSGPRGPFEPCPSCGKRGIYSWQPFMSPRQYRCRYCHYRVSAERWQELRRAAAPAATTAQQREGE